MQQLQSEQYTNNTGCVCLSSLHFNIDISSIPVAHRKQTFSRLGMIQRVVIQKINITPIKAVLDRPTAHVTKLNYSDVCKRVFHTTETSEWKLINYGYDLKLVVPVLKTWPLQLRTELVPAVICILQHLYCLPACLLSNTHIRIGGYNRGTRGRKGVTYNINPLENNGASVFGGFQILHSTTAQVT